MDRFLPVIVIMSVLTFMNPPLQAQTAGTDEGARKPGLKLAVSASYMNSYNRGNLDDFFHFIASDPTRDVDSGSAAFFDVALIIPFPDATESFSMGIGIGALLCDSHGLWGTRLVFGGRAEIALKPWMIYVSMPARIALVEGGVLDLALDPAFIMGFVTGHVTTLGGTRYEIIPAPKPGFQVPVGIDLNMSRNLGFTVRVGYRMASGDVMYKDETSGTGYSQFTIDDEKVVAGMSGMFATLGVVLGF